MLRSRSRSIGLGGNGTFVLALVVAAAPLASGQVGGTDVQLQSSTPGTQQKGNTNVSGRMIAGSFQGNGARLSNVDASTLGGFYPAAFVRTGSPSLVFADSLGGAVLTVYDTNLLGTGTAIDGVSAGGTGIGVFGRLGAFSGNVPSVGSGVTGDSYHSFGVVGASHSFPGVYGASTDNPGVSGASTNDDGVYGNSVNSVGVYGDSSSNYGVYGHSSASVGVGGFSNSSVGVYGTSNNSYGVLCGGDFAATGYKNFVVDHPLDPANRTLKHSCSEGSEPLDVYSGNVATDARGYATVVMPRWFEALNRDFRYQLTVVDDGEHEEFVQVKVVQEVANNQFRLRTSAPDVKVSWQLTGVRNDAWARLHPPVVEEDKPVEQRGKYLAPEAFGRPKEIAIEPVKSSSDRACIGAH